MAFRNKINKLSSLFGDLYLIKENYITIKNAKINGRNLLEFQTEHWYFQGKHYLYHCSDMVFTKDKHENSLAVLVLDKLNKKRNSFL